MRELVAVAIRSGSAAAALHALLGQTVEPPASSPGAWLHLMREHGSAAWTLVSTLWAASVSVVTGVVVFAVVLYSRSVNCRHLYAWLARCLPV